MKRICGVDKAPFYTKMVICNFSKNRYSGEWKNGKRHGEGVYENHNGEKYVGHFEED